MIHPIKKITLTLIIFIIFSFSLSAMDIKEGRIKLVLNETNGRFSLYYQTDPVEGEYTPLLLDQDPRTSGITLIINDEDKVTLGDSFDFDQKITKTPNGARISWNSKELYVYEDFSFVASPDSAVADGIKIRITIKNISEESMSVGLKYLFDTYLGEESKNHFYTEHDQSIVKETVLKGLMEKYWVSTADHDSPIGFLSMLDNTLVTPPDKVIFANWKRLNESGWILTTKEGRDFDLLPFSINDSAVSQYYYPVKLKKNEIRNIDLIIGNKTKTGFTKDTLSSNSIAVAIRELYNKIMNSNIDILKESSESIAKNQLTLVNEYMELIDKIIKVNKSLTRMDMELIDLMYMKLEKNRNEFEKKID
ncbi:MAG: hypothetical protein PQJ46_12085 [Spirochaetales bacterium]|nr:hypothetical protein [Spirochaetales bacterium]